LQTDEITAVIITALADVLKDKGIEAATGPDFQLFGSGSVIDSLDLVAIIVRMEEAITTSTGKTVEIVDENSMVGDDSPFRTVASLAVMAKVKIDAA